VLAACQVSERKTMFSSRCGGCRSRDWYQNACYCVTVLIIASLFGYCATDAVTVFSDIVQLLYGVVSDLICSRFQNMSNAYIPILTWNRSISHPSIQFFFFFFQARSFGMSGSLRDGNSDMVLALYNGMGCWAHIVNSVPMRIYHLFHSVTVTTSNFIAR